MHLTPADRHVHPLLPGLNPRRLADGTIALGTDPVHGAVLTGATMDEAGRILALIVRLAELSGPASPSALAAAVGLPVDRVEELCRELDRTGLTVRGVPEAGGTACSAWVIARRGSGGESVLTGAAPLSMRQRRAASRVVIDGSGTLVHDIGRLLRAAGVGQVRAGWHAAAAEDQDPDGPDPTLVITVAARLPVARARDWATRGVAHLPVLTRPASVDVGPLVLPGSGPCLDCVVLAEHGDLGAGPSGELLDLVADGQDDGGSAECTLAAVAAGTVAMLALGVTDAYPPPLGLRWHTALPLPSLAVSRWAVHPRCAASRHSHATNEPEPGDRAATGASVQGGTLVW